MQTYLTDNVKLLKVADAAGANTTEVAGASVDMQADGGWDGCLFLTSLGTPAANNIMKAQQSDDDGVADGFSDLADSAVPVSTSDEDQFIDIREPAKRYLKPIITRGTSTTVENIWAILYRGRELPHNNVLAGTIQGVQLNRPAEGTA